jgi:hypothetical protein
MARDKLDGSSKEKCSRCSYKSVPGLSNPLCPYHFAVVFWGRVWANQCHPTHPEAKRAG